MTTCSPYVPGHTWTVPPDVDALTAAWIVENDCREGRQVPTATFCAAVAPAAASVNNALKRIVLNMQVLLRKLGLRTHDRAGEGVVGRNAGVESTREMHAGPPLGYHLDAKVRRAARLECRSWQGIRPETIR